MQLKDWIYAVVTLASGIAAIFAWVSKIRWSNEFIKANDAIIAAKDAAIGAKDATIAAKDAHIERLQDDIRRLLDLSSPKLEELFKATKEGLERAVDGLEAQLAAANAEIVRLGEALKQAKVSVEELQRIKIEKSALEVTAQKLGAQVVALKTQVNQIPRIDLRPVFSTSAELEHYLPQGMTGLERLLDTPTFISRFSRYRLPGTEDGPSTVEPPPSDHVPD